MARRASAEFAALPVADGRGRPLRARSRRPLRQGRRHARCLERHHLELACRWRPVIGGIDGIADLRSRAEFCRLSRFWDHPRSGRPGAACRVASRRISEPSDGAADVIVRPDSADIVVTYAGDSPAAGLPETDLPAKRDVASSDAPLPLASNAFETSPQTD